MDWGQSSGGRGGADGKAHLEALNSFCVLAVIYNARGDLLACESIDEIMDVSESHHLKECCGEQCYSEQCCSKQCYGEQCYSERCWLCLAKLAFAFTVLYWLFSTAALCVWLWTLQVFNDYAADFDIEELVSGAREREMKYSKLVCALGAPQAARFTHCTAHRTVQHWSHTENRK